jgi:homoserine kinase
LARVRVSVPATINNFGPGLSSVALALRLYQSVELTETDSGFTVEVQPPRPDAETERIRAAVIEAVRAVCHKTLSTPSGLRVVIAQEDLAGRGLGLSAGLPLGCATAVNALCGGPLGRDEILDLVLGMGCRPAPVIASLRGNLSIAADDGPAGLRTGVTPASQEVIVITPPTSDGRDAHQGKSGAGPLGVITSLLVEALRAGDHVLLHELSQHLMKNRQLGAKLSAACRAASQAGASAVFIHERELSGVVFARSKHDKIVEAMAEACPGASCWTIPMETHGISIDAVDVSVSAGSPPIPAGRRPSASQEIPSGQHE